MSNIDERKELGPRWSVAHTYSGYENKIKNSLEKVIENKGLSDQFFDIQIPVEVVIEKKGDVEKEVEHKLFPCYVYIKMVMNDETWHAVRNIQGVTGFVGPGSRPTPISEKEVQALGLEKTAEEVQTEKKIALAFKEGDEVKIIAGLFEGVTGTVQSISEDLTVATVMVAKGRRVMPVEIETAQLERVNA